MSYFFWDFMDGFRLVFISMCNCFYFIVEVRELDESMDMWFWDLNLGFCKGKEYVF